MIFVTLFVFFTIFCLIHIKFSEWTWLRYWTFAKQGNVFPGNVGLPPRRYPRILIWSALYLAAAVLVWLFYHPTTTVAQAKPIELPRCGEGRMPLLQIDQGKIMAASCDAKEWVVYRTPNACDSPDLWNILTARKLDLDQLVEQNNTRLSECNNTNRTVTRNRKL